ncbi:hypothetical protein HZA33_02195 [Candidatus Pacearchaeota archaeon]|nr:hypothetical protein [Candidatus Pacearchaeota archaeon]
MDEKRERKKYKKRISRIILPIIAFIFISIFLSVIVSAVIVSKSAVSIYECKEGNITGTCTLSSIQTLDNTTEQFGITKAGATGAPNSGRLNTTHNLSLPSGTIIQDVKVCISAWRDSGIGDSSFDHCYLAAGENSTGTDSYTTVLADSLETCLNWSSTWAYTTQVCGNITTWINSKPDPKSAAENLLISFYGYDDSDNNMDFWIDFVFVNITYIIDNAAPNLTIISPLNQTYTTTAIGFNVTLNENGSSCLLELDKASNISMNKESNNRNFNYTNSSMTQGSHVARFYCNDTAGNMNLSTSNSITFNISDITPPIITISSPLNQTYISTTISFNASINRAGLCFLSIDSSGNQSMTNLGGNNFGLINSTMQGGSHNAVFSCNDTANSWSFSSVIFNIDITSPAITILSPANQTYTRDTIPYNISLSETGSWCGFFMDTDTSANNISMTSDANKRYWNYTKTGLTQGSHNITFICNDTSNNYNTSKLNNVTFNVYLNTAPSVINITILPNSTSEYPYGNSTLNCSFEVYDADLANDLKINVSWFNSSTYYNSSTFTVLAASRSAGGYYNYSLALGQGQAASAPQAKGNTWNCSINVSDASADNLKSNTTYIVNTLPTLSLANFTLNPTPVYAASVGVNCTIRAGDVDSDALTYTYLWYKNNVSTGVTTQNITSASFTDGDVLTCQGVANDGTANSAMVNSSNLTITDINPPAITIISPTNATYLVSIVGFNVTLSETGSWCGFFMDTDTSANNISMTSDANKRYWNYTKTGLTQGVHNATFICNDSAGNLNSSFIYFNLDSAAPTINLITQNNSVDTDGNIILRYNVTDASDITNCSLFLNNELNQTNFSITKNEEQQFLIYNLTGGKYNWSINCTDSVNNKGFSEKREFIVIITSKFNGLTTNLSQVNLSSITNLILENMEYGTINFSELIDLSGVSDIESYANISFNKIEINSTGLPSLNKSAYIYFYNLTFSSPRALRDGSTCPSTICTNASYSAGIFSYAVTQFSVYSSEETPTPAPPASSSRRSDEGGGYLNPPAKNETESAIQNQTNATIPVSNISNATLPSTAVKGTVTGSIISFLSTRGNGSIIFAIASLIVIVLATLLLIRKRRNRPF